MFTLGRLNIIKDLSRNIFLKCIEMLNSHKTKLVIAIFLFCFKSLFIILTLISQIKSIVYLTVFVLELIISSVCVTDCQFGFL